MSRRATPVRGRVGDSRGVAEGRRTGAVPPDGGSKYAPRAVGRPGAQHRQYDAHSGRDDDRDFHDHSGDVTACPDDSNRGGDDSSRVAESRGTEAVPGGGESQYRRAVTRETSPMARLPVEDGEVIARLESPELSDGAADALWRIVEKAARREAGEENR